MTITGDVVSMAFGGKGILRHENRVIFVPYTVPGDRIVCRVTRQSKNFAEAKLLELIQPSPQRTTPPCPYFGTCGGCQLQHMDYSAQLKYKQQSVEDALKRIGKLDTSVSPIIPAETRWFYRRHVTLTLKEQEGCWQAGYIADDHHSFLPISECPIFIPSADPILKKLQGVVKELQFSPKNVGKIVIFKQADHTFYLQWHFKYLPTNALEIIEKTLTNFPEWIGCSISTLNSSHQLGKKELCVEIDGLIIHFSPRAFIQNHPEQSLKIYRLILNEVLLSKASSVLDLYCGIGIISLLLARHGIDVKGVETNREAIKMAQANGKNNGCKATFICADAKQVIRDLLNTKPDCAIVNPPREGMEADVIEALRKEGPPTLIYVSCMPTTLARDLQSLCQNRYRLEKCQPFDMFPQTGHVETVAFLKV